MNASDINNIIRENKARRKALFAPYDPVTGVGSPIEREKIEFSVGGNEFVWGIPVTMYNENAALIDAIAREHKLETVLQAHGIPADSTGIELFLRDLINQRFRYDYEFWSVMAARIQDKRTKQIVPFTLNQPQRKVLKVVEGKRIADEPIRIIIDKARQWGGSTLVQIYMAWIQLIHRTRWHSCIVTDIEEQARNIRAMYSRLINNYPRDLGGFELSPLEGSNKNRRIDERDCSIIIGSSQKPDSLRTFDLAMAHLCLSPDTLIPTEDGFLKRIDELTANDIVITHTGKRTKVKTITVSTPSSLNGNGRAISITPWMGQPITLTPNHPVLTKRGWIAAEEIKHTDWLAQPVRKITHEIKEIKLPYYPLRKRGGGKRPKGNGATIILSQEIGFALGYYLAEGSVQKQDCRIGFAGIILTRHDSEVNYGDRAVKAFLPYVSSHTRKKRENTKTTIEVLYSSVFAKWINDNLGIKEYKRIPDWFFRCGTDFLLGVLQGYLSGDGSKTNGKQRHLDIVCASVTTVSSSLALQIRDVAASLGLGWGAIDIRDKGVFYGRNCKKRYTVRWAGSSARAIKQCLGQNFPDNGHAYSEKSVLDGDIVWFKIRAIQHTELKTVVDLEVEHKDHSFRTLTCSVKNSEVSFWKTTELRSAEDLAQSVRAGVAQVPFSLIALESTAKGVGNFFHREWLTAIDGKSAYAPVFVAWYEIELYQKDIPEADLGAFVKWMDAEPYASYLWSLGATLEGIKWYFDFKAGENYDEWRMKSEFPSTWEESFQATGARVFSPAYVNKARKHKMDPEFVGDIRGKTLRDKTALEDIELIQADRGNLFIWMYPDKEEQVSNRYVVSMDIGGRNPDADYTVMRVFDRYGIMDGGVPETIATWRGHCFVPGTQIYTSMGFKNIEDIGIGDEVWTHKNRFRKVLKTYKRHYDGEVISLRSQGNYETVTCTPEHPFYSNETFPMTRRSPLSRPGRYTYYTRDSLGEPSWIRASDLKYFAYSRERKTRTHPPFIINKYNGGKSKHTLREITDLKTFFSILGYYLAEGHINRRSKDRSQFQSICFSFSYYERDTVAKDCYEKLLSLGFKCSIIEYKSVSVCRVRAYDTFLTKLVLDLCGEHSWGKRLSPIIFDYPIELLSILLNSYWKGDGSVYKTDQSVSNIITTVSPVLARQIRDILILLGHRPGTYRVVGKTKAKGIKKVRPRYNVVWSASEIKKNVLLQNEDHVVYKVKSKEIYQYSGPVFNLEVEDDNSYSTACYIVHNCDQDLAAWKGVQLARMYNNALFIPESNSYDKTSIEAEGNHFLTILDEIVKFYPNIFARTDPEKIRQGIPIKYGFHTNPVSKPMIIDFLNACLRDDLFYERDERVCSELDTYEIKPNGRYGAVDGCHDDMVMATAIGLWACLKHLPPPKIITPTVKRRPGRITEATI